MLKVMRERLRINYHWFDLEQRGIRRLFVRACQLQLGDIGRGARSLDIRKPVHAVLIGALVAGILAPVVSYVVTNERYRLSDAAAAVAERPSPKLMSKLRYDSAQKANVFNAEGRGNEQTNIKDKLQASIGAGGKKDNQLYTATLPDDPTQGIDIHDNVNDISVKFVPQMKLMEGRGENGHVTYPFKDQAGQILFTPKGNGIKEDILLETAPEADTADYTYRLDVPASVEPRMEPDGSMGFYVASPELFGNISYGTDKDRELVDKARVNGAKNYLLFRVPAPVIHETGKRSLVSARFALNGKNLTVHATGLKQAHYPLSIDPTFLLTSTSDFVLGSPDDNIDLSVAGQVGRQALVGGSTPGWTPNSAPALLNGGNFASAIVAYNGFLFMIGGGNDNSDSVTSRKVEYISLDATTGALGTGTPAVWTPTSILLTARQGLVAFGFNGYLYAVGGEGNTSVPVAPSSSVEFAKINADGSVGTWALTTGQLTTARGYPAGASYQGVLYVMGGSNGTFNASLQTTIEYARINGDGNISAWTQSASSATGNLSGARNRFQGAAYNGFLYITGGLTAAPAVLSSTEYAPIKSDGTVGAWLTTTSFPTARRDNGMGVNNGYLYVYGGCASATFICPTFQSDTQYAVINADGTIGQWQRTVDYNTGGFSARLPGGSTFYSGHLYFTGGCAGEASATNDKCAVANLRNGTFITNIDTVGRFDRGISTIQTTAPFNNTAATVARMGAQAVALNGYMYLIGGCSTVSCNTTTSYSNVAEYAQLNTDGSLGTFTPTNALIDNSAAANTAGRIGMSVLAYNNKIYVIGGVERTTPGNVDAFRVDVLSSTQNSNGTLNAWAPEASSLPVAKAFASAVVWHNWLYVLGGLSAAGTVVGTIFKSQISSSNAPGTWAATTSSLSNARWGHAGGTWGNWIYVVGGQSNTSGTYISAAAGTEQLTINNTGDITAAASVQSVTGAPLTRFMGGFVHNGFIYTFGGYTSGSTAAVATTNWSQLNATTGALGAWSNTNIGNNAATFGLSQARGATTAVSSGGNFYVLGGCSATMATATFSSCATFVTTANTTEVSLPNNGGTGQTSVFTTGSSNAVDLPNIGGTAGRADHAAVAYNGKLYIIGGCRLYTAGVCTAQLGDIQRADINTDGTITGSWTAQTAMPGGEVRSQLKAVAYNGYLYVVGGQSAGATATASVWYVVIDNTGTLGGTWSNVSNALSDDLPVNRRDFGMATSSGFLYVVGGEDATPTKQTTVYYATINTDGTLGAWNTTTPFTTARTNFGFATYSGVLYIVGGFDGTNNLTDVQTGIINTAGTITSWNFSTDVARGARSRQVVASNGFIYYVGDEGANTDITYAAIGANVTNTSTGTLSTIQRSANVMNGAHAHGAAVVYNGTIYDTGGCTLNAGTCNVVTAANDRGGQKAISRVGHYSKLFNTQVDTSPTQLVINGANYGPGSAVEFKLQTASSSDPVLGIAQLIRPVVFNNFYTVQALNSSGANVGVALNYLFLIALDDSRSGTFPDVANSVGGYSQTSVTDITLNYHANPGRRLRHGASFTNTDCNPTSVSTEGCLLDTAP